jgi:hypothetical protein
VRDIRTINNSNEDGESFARIIKKFGRLVFPGALNSKSSNEKYLDQKSSSTHSSIVWQRTCYEKCGINTTLLIRRISFRLLFHPLVCLLFSAMLEDRSHPSDKSAG